MAAHGYFFPISDHVLTLKDDGTFYRFQVCSLITVFFFFLYSSDKREYFKTISKELKLSVEVLSSYAPLGGSTQRSN